MRYLILLTSLFIGFISCQEDDLLTSSSAKLEFSTDTVMFDTVFTGIGSATQRFKVYNRHSQPIRISSVELAKGNSSQYGINVDGVSANQVKDVQIEANDSIYVFVEVNIDPSTDDIIEKDSILFYTNGNIQDVKTIAFGQNVNLLMGQSLNTQTWDATRPYLVYTSCLVDSLETLTIEAGTKVYFHENASLFVLGSLIVNGTLDEPVLFKGDRLEEFYQDKPGQWGAYTTLENGATYVFGGLHFLPGSFDNKIDYAIIKNANKGIQLDSAVGNNYTLEITNSIISHMNLAGIYAQTSRVKGENLVLNNCGSHAIAMVLGGKYNFNHVSIANFTPYSSRNTASVALNNYFVSGDVGFVYDLEEATFTNSIIYGDGGENGNEIVIDKADEGAFNYYFDHCLIKVSEDFDMSNENHFQNILRNPESGPRFVSKEEYDFRLDTLSPAIDAGKAEYGAATPLDMNQNDRTTDAGPDLGAYERQQ
ncbi:hypothetical protein L21SP5_03109 [Salinivirga cyanobacteriivorans]|uniref:Right handed beta helix domain-containing protein n=1 Tax=Salinivirga cyanobacteriivorans TaxID=1307839 RepID=A0A0S2I3C7_9BACT|nr:choice-of-anchor Q domain-containing protein [Salinivirga cyanobacteriivorans]ALO16724.1 hypothetical protein L21SP5_03109 [Salinivirga cyanobacteriivorans]